MKSYEEKSLNVRHDDDDAKVDGYARDAYECSQHQFPRWVLVNSFAFAFFSNILYRGINAYSTQPVIMPTFNLTFTCHPMPGWHICWLMS